MTYRYVTAHTPPTVKAGDVIRVHVPELTELWVVDEVLGGSWGYLLRISQDRGAVVRTIAP
jgi:hypothetical protein